MGISYKNQRKILIASFMFLPMLMLIVFFIYPFIRLIILSFYDYRITSLRNDFVGFDNYIEVFQDKEVWNSFCTTFYYVVNGIIQNIFGLYLAIVLTSKIRFKNFYKSTIFLPYILNSAAVAFMFAFIFDFQKGPINEFLRIIGIFGENEGIQFLSSSELVNFSLAGVSLWRYLGFSMVLYIAGIQSINRELYEAAMIDGANWWQKHVYITLPSIKRIIELNLFLTLSGGLQAFVEPMILTKGGPGTASTTYMLKAMYSFINFDKYGYAAAMAIIMLIIVLILSFIQRKIVRE